MTLDIDAERDGEPVAGLNTEDWLYEVGRGWVRRRLRRPPHRHHAGRRADLHHDADRHRRAGRLHRRRQEGAGARPARADRRVGRRTPGVRDGRRVARRHPRAHWRRPRLNSARQLLLERASGALAELVEEDPPGAARQQRAASAGREPGQRLQAQGVSMEQYMAMTGQDPATLTEGAAGQRHDGRQGRPRAPGRRRRRGARGQRRGPGGRVRAHRRPGRPEAHAGPQGLRAQRRGVRPRAEIRKAKALEWLLRHVEIVDTEGAPSTAISCSRRTRSSSVPGEVDRRARPRRPRPRRPRPRRTATTVTHPPTDEAETP